MGSSRLCLHLFVSPYYTVVINLSHEYVYMKSFVYISRESPKVGESWELPTQSLMQFVIYYD